MCSQSHGVDTVAAAASVCGHGLVPWIAELGEVGVAGSRTEDTRGAGRTSWARSALLFVPGAAAVVAIVMAMAQGAVASQFAVASSKMKLGVASLDAGEVTGFVGSDPAVRGGKEGMILLGVGNGTAEKLCLSSLVEIPLVGAVTLTVGAGQNAPVGIGSLTANATDLLTPDGTLTDAELGRDGSTLDENRLLRGPSGSWGLQAGGLKAKDVRITAFNGAASSLRLTGVAIQVRPGKHECF